MDGFLDETDDDASLVVVTVPTTRLAAAMGFFRKQHRHQWGFQPVSPRKRKQSFVRRFFLLRPFVWLYNRKKKNGQASPEKTALMSFEDFSYSNDPQLSDSYSTDSNHAVFQRGFPYWDSPQRTGHSAVPKQPSIQQPVKKDRASRLRLTLCNILDSKANTDDPSVPPQDDDSQHFSISSDIQQSAFTRIKVYENIPPQTEKPSPTVSLERFIEDKNRVTTLPSLNLGNISANDSASVASALLGVSYDEDYPQLVLQPSLDGSRTTGGGSTAGSTLGASFSHPAGSNLPKTDSFEQIVRDVSCTPRWLDDSIDKVWEQIDKESSTEDDLTTESGSWTRTPEKPECDWGENIVERASELTASAEESVKNFSSKLETGVVQPILKPICRLVESAQMPAPKHRLVEKHAKRKQSSNKKASSRQSQSRFRIVKKL